MKHASISRFVACMFGLFFSSVGLAVAGYDFSFSIGGNTGFGHLDTEDLGGGVFHATGGSLTVTGGLDANATPYPLGPGGPGPTPSPSTAFEFDNLVLPGFDPALTPYGLFFIGNDLEINIFNIANVSGVYVFASCIISSGCGAPETATYNVLDVDNDAVFSVTASVPVTVPEPGTLWLLGVGLFAGAMVVKRRS